MRSQGHRLRPVISLAICTFTAILSFQFVHATNKVGGNIKYSCVHLKNRPWFYFVCLNLGRSEVEVRLLQERI